MELSPTTLINRHADAIATEIDGEIMVLSLTTGRSYGLDLRGSRIWQLLEQPRTVDQLVAELLKRYDTTADQCREDLVHFLGQMIQGDLLQAGGPQTAGAAAGS